MIQLLVIALVALLVGCEVMVMPPVEEKGKPNIVILFADDLGYGDLASYGHPSVRTPNLDILAREGQRWTDFYVAAPVCSPSRGALLTGKLPNRTGLYGRQINVLFPNDTAGMPAREFTLAEALKQQGYATAIIGKWHLGDALDVYPTRHGFDYWYGLPYSNDMDWVDEMTSTELMALAAQGKMIELQEEITARLTKYFDPKFEYWNVPLIRSEKHNNTYTDEVLERPVDQRTLTRRYTEEAIDFIERSKARPFLLYLPYTMPHAPIFRSDAFIGKSLVGRYGDVLEELDWSVGEIVSKLKELNLDRNTLVVFTSDNGPWLLMKQHGGTAGILKQGKGTTFEGGMRVPAIFWWPGAVKPGTRSGIGSTLDIYTTVLSLAGAGPLSGSNRLDLTDMFDGFDLTDTLLNETPSPRNVMAYYRSGELRAFRKGPYKLHLITEGAFQQPPAKTVHHEPLLYHLGDDPGERFDIAAQNPSVVADLMQAIKRHRFDMIEQPPIFDQRLKAVPR
jgi:arylsulfatase A